MNDSNKVNWLRELRGFHITQHELALEMGLCSNVYISRIESEHIEPSDKWRQRATDAINAIKKRRGIR